MSQTRSQPARIGMCYDRTFPGRAVPELARRLEDAGADELWLIEDCFFTTAPPLAALALSATERLRVGLGILPAVSRTAAVSAMEIATLASIGPGRVAGGIGHGVQSWMRQMGVATPSPLTTLEEVLGAVRRLLAGETVTTHGREVTLEDVRLEHVPEPTPPVLAGVSGPKSLALAGRVADGVVLAGPSTVPYVRSAVAAASGAPGFEVVSFTTMVVDEDPREAYRLAAPFVAEMLQADFLGFRELPFLAELKERHAAGGLEAVVGMPAPWWVQIGAIGTRDDAAEHVALLEAEGVTSVSFFPPPDLDAARRQVEEVGALVRDRR